MKPAIAELVLQIRTRGFDLVGLLRRRRDDRRSLPLTCSPSAWPRLARRLGRLLLVATSAAGRSFDWPRRRRSGGPIPGRERRSACPSWGATGARADRPARLRLKTDARGIRLSAPVTERGRRSACLQLSLPRPPDERDAGGRRARPRTRWLRRSSSPTAVRRPSSNGRAPRSGCRLPRDPSIDPTRLVWRARPGGSRSRPGSSPLATSHDLVRLRRRTRAPEPSTDHRCDGPRDQRRRARDHPRRRPPRRQGGPESSSASRPASPMSGSAAPPGGDGFRDGQVARVNLAPQDRPSSTRVIRFPFGFATVASPASRWRPTHPRDRARPRIPRPTIPAGAGDRLMFLTDGVTERMSSTSRRDRGWGTAMHPREAVHASSRPCGSRGRPADRRRRRDGHVP